MRGIRWTLRRVVKCGFKEVLVKVRRHDRGRVFLAVQQKQQLKGAKIGILYSKSFYDNSHCNLNCNTS